MPNQNEIAMDYAAFWPAHGKAWKAVRAPFDIPDCIHLGLFERRDGLRAIVTIDLLDAAKSGHWLHLSVSRPRRLPTWPDMVSAAHGLGYAERAFVQLVPPRENWINIHEFTLHLLSRLDAPTVPDALWQQEGTTGYGRRAIRG